MMWLEFLLRPHRRPRGVPGRLRRQEERLVQPGRHPGHAHQGPGPGQGQRLHQGLLLDHRRLQRRPGAALHRQGRDDAARRLDLREHEDRRRRLRLRRRPRLHELPAGRGRQGRPERHRRQPRPVPVDLLQGHRRSRRTSPRSSSPPRCSTTPRSRSGSTTGEVPIVKGADEPARPRRTDADFLKFVYDIASKAKIFAQSWDQALTPTAAETLLDNIAKLFQLSITPAAVRRQHERGHRQVTALAPPAAQADTRSHAPAGGRQPGPSPGWRCRRW